MEAYHIPVLLHETITFLNVQKGEGYIDATLGGGGHTGEILRRGGRVLGIDVDEEAIEHAKKILRDKDIKILSKKEDKTHNISVSQYPNITLVRGNFKDIGYIARSHGFERVAGILFDLGVSSHQLETGERGFSFQKEGPLDMRMDKGLFLKASDLVNVLTKGELYELYRRLGEERYARAISEAIVRARRINPIVTTAQLAEIVQEATHSKFSKINPATRVFQALRIAVNDELHVLEEAIPQAIDLLKAGGRMGIISFHSLEDRIVKNAFNTFVAAGKGRLVAKKPITALAEEVTKNRRSRSAKLRVFEKI